MVRLIPKIAKSTKMLIIGSNLGATVMALEREFGCKIECLDPHTEYNKRLEKQITAEEMEKKVSVSEGILSSFPFDRETFDIVWAQDTLVNVKKKAKLFREVQRVLNPKGRFVYTSLAKKSDAPASALEDAVAHLNVKELAEVDDYSTYARKALLLKVYTALLTEYLPQHLANLRQAITAPFPKGVKAPKAAILKGMEEELAAWEKASEQDALEWGVFIFQKINA
jgi:ubiquinone/menaquinone biosynthesis C-methylase UbiE